MGAAIGTPYVGALGLVLWLSGRIGVGRALAYSLIAARRGLEVERAGMTGDAPSYKTATRGDSQ
jgi:hypothetical protein